MAALLQGAQMMDVKGLKVVTVKKDELLPKIKANKEQHVKEFKETYDAWLILRKEAVEKGIKEVRSQLKSEDELTQGYVQFEIPVKPQSHQKDYDRVISMLEMSVDEELDLPVDEFARYALDEWDWSVGFKSTSAIYVNSVGSNRK
jgi:hypothetical protein